MKIYLSDDMTGYVPLNYTYYSKLIQINIVRDSMRVYLQR